MIHFKKARWIDISKSLDGKRTEHMVKNRYNSLIKKWQRSNGKKNNRFVEKKII